MRGRTRRRRRMPGELLARHATTRPSTQERVPIVRLELSGGNLFRSDGLPDGVRSKSTPSPGHDRESGQSPDHDRGGPPTKSVQTMEAERAIQRVDAGAGEGKCRSSGDVEKRQLEATLLGP